MNKRILLLCLLILLMLPLIAQPDNPNNPVPIDGGLGLLSAAGIAYAASRLKNRGKTKEE